MDWAIPLGAMVGAIAGYLGYAQRRIRAYQRRSMLVPALLMKRDFPGLAMLATWTLGGLLVGLGLGYVLVQGLRVQAS